MTGYIMYICQEAKVGPQATAGKARPLNCICHMLMYQEETAKAATKKVKADQVKAAKTRLHIVYVYLSGGSKCQGGRGRKEQEEEEEEEATTPKSYVIC